ncbi:caspase family protein [Microbacterium thalassium]|uniref:Peptidase C14 caspase domain-containing protein n=1 Tax=Microbacterium thalassium TaxID=362649 RepID=A0A7X0FPS9_9MICO|nr:caspase family protein [Microbacterium thalassium]MBB6390985.1 hypothetical protein [Microbacterium thalassium]GLK24844.1 hypothetical protein GCM10017607_21620 [Microbacterium thalassium]
MSTETTEPAGATRGGFSLTPAQLARMRGHVIHMKDGRLADKSVARPGSIAEFTTTEQDVKNLVAKDLRKFVDDHPGTRVPVVIWAHGGLVDKESGFETAFEQIEWWKANGVYPIHMVWESGLLTSIGGAIARRATGARGFFDVTDSVIEVAARLFGGRGIWDEMKLDAAAASLDGGGGDVLIDALSALIATDEVDVSLHAIGHSAGSIFHSHFVAKALSGPKPRLREFETVTFLAPAVRVDTFESTLLPLAKRQAIKELSIFTMDDEHEQDDSCVGVYRKSLLYLVSRAFEPERGAAILGMEKHLSAAGNTMRYLGAGSERLVYGPVTGGPRTSSNATSHGDFDNDAPTMESVARRVTGSGSVTPFEPLARASRAVPPPLPAPALAGARGAAPARRALCIGIDAYPSDPLSGAVADARDWERWFTAAGFDTDVIVDGAATREAVLARMLDAVATSTAGDSLVIQYSGHGTFVKDLDGDEDDAETFGAYDEALCPVDFRDGKLIIDDDLAPIWDVIPDGVAVTLLFDCCHSGTASRGLPARADGPEPVAGRRARFVRLDGPTIDRYEAERAVFRGDPVSAAARASVLEAETGRAANVTKNRPEVARREVLVSACKPDEVAWEKGGHGVFTQAALGVLTADPAISAKAFLAAVLDTLGPDRDQTPVLTGDEALVVLPLLGGATVSAPAAAPGALPAVRGTTEDVREAAIVSILRATADLLETRG